MWMAKFYGFKGMYDKVAFAYVKFLQSEIVAALRTKALAKQRGMLLLHEIRVYSKHGQVRVGRDMVAAGNSASWQKRMPESYLSWALSLAWSLVQRFLEMVKISANLVRRRMTLVTNISGFLLDAGFGATMVWHVGCCSEICAMDEKRVQAACMAVGR
jgi:hypothetical protein